MPGPFAPQSLPPTASTLLPNAKVHPHGTPWCRYLFLALAGWLLGLTALAVFASHTWPLVNDAALLHYISFMMDSGKAPYRQLLDMDLPGALLIDWSATHLLGPGAAAWRVFDGLVCLGLLLAILAIAPVKARFAGLFSGTLFWLLHLRDGPGQAGQRDLVEAMLLLAAVAWLCRARRSGRLWPLLPAGACTGVAVTIKPDVLLFSAFFFFMLLRSQRGPGRSRQQALALSVAGFLLPILLVATFLLHQHALTAFAHTVTEIIPYYASLGRLSLPRLLRDWLPAPLRLLVLATLLLAAAHLAPRIRISWSWEHTVLLGGVLWGLASFLLQGKGFPYQRYPSLAFLLSLAGLVLVDAIRAAGWPRLVALVMLAYAVVFIAPVSLQRARYATWNQSLLDALQEDLTSLGGQHLDHNIQCLDNIVGCNNVLLRLQLHQQTGMLSDFLIFGPDTVPAVRHTRQAFWHDLAVQLPHVIVVTGALHPSAPGAPDHQPFAKLDTWPALTKLLAARYTLAADRTFAPGLNGPLAYRIYVLQQP